jgi:uncharacterized protein (DUF934 family)
MPLVKDGKVVIDRFVAVADDAPLPSGGAVLVSAVRFLVDHRQLATRVAPVGVAWPNNRPVAELAPHVGRLKLIVLSFPTFKDGRAYTQARVLREQLGFRGELRATGEVLRDQFAFMVRAGFDAFEVRKAVDAAAFAEAIGRYSVFYQPTGDGRPAVLRVRVDTGVARSSPQVAGAGVRARSSPMPRLARRGDGS